MAAVVETCETGRDELLQTHYYRASYKQVKDRYLEILESLGHNIISVNDEYYEIASEYGNMSIVAKIIMQTPIETSIDFYINVESFLGGAGKARKFIEQVYSSLEKSFEPKGLGLHK